MWLKARSSLICWFHRASGFCFDIQQYSAEKVIYGNGQICKQGISSVLVINIFMPPRLNEWRIVVQVCVSVCLSVQFALPTDFDLYKACVHVVCSYSLGLALSDSINLDLLVTLTMWLCWGQGVRVRGIIFYQGLEKLDLFLMQKHNATSKYYANTFNKQELLLCAF